MKAKTYYMHPDDPAIAKELFGAKEPNCLTLWSRKDYPYMGVNVEFKVIKSSDIPKMVERAAATLYTELGHGTRGEYAGLRRAVKGHYAGVVRAQFKTLGLLP